MRASGWALVVVALLAPAAALAQPKPQAVDIKPFRAELLVYKDAAGGIYVIKPAPDQRVFYGTEKTGLFEQFNTGRSADGDSWIYSTWAPRIAELRPGMIQRKKDGTVHKSCDGKDDYVLTQLTGDKAKAILDKSAFKTPGIVYVPHLLARDDAGVYYYVDRVAKLYGGNGHRVWVGKKGAMKQLPLTDVAMDAAGDVFATKTGDLRLVKDGSTKVSWVKGERRRELIILDLDVNSPLIFRDLGIYKFLGTICDNI